MESAGRSPCAGPGRGEGGRTPLLPRTGFGAAEDYEAHPAFSKLSLESKGTGDGVLFTRRNRRRGRAAPPGSAVGPAGGDL